MGGEGAGEAMMEDGGGAGAEENWVAGLGEEGKG